jgi:hypothetical protein
MHTMHRRSSAGLARLNLVVERDVRRELRIIAAQRETTLRQLVRDLLEREVRERVARAQS